MAEVNLGLVKADTQRCSVESSDSVRLGPQCSVSKPLSREAVETTAATKGTDRRKAAAATWMAVHKGILASKRKLPEGALTEIKNHFNDTKNSKFLEERVLECRAVITFDQGMMLFSWWVRNLDSVEMALLEIIVQLGADVKHNPAPPYGLERDTSEALAEVLALVNSGQAGSSTDIW